MLRHSKYRIITFIFLKINFGCDNGWIILEGMGQNVFQPTCVTLMLDPHKSDTTKKWVTEGSLNNYVTHHHQFQKGSNDQADFYCAAMRKQSYVLPKLPLGRSEIRQTADIWACLDERKNSRDKMAQRGGRGVVYNECRRKMRLNFAWNTLMHTGTSLHT